MEFPVISIVSLNISILRYVKSINWILSVFTESIRSPIRSVIGGSNLSHTQIAFDCNKSTQSLCDSILSHRLLFAPSFANRKHTHTQAHRTQYRHNGIEPIQASNAIGAREIPLFILFHNFIHDFAFGARVCIGKLNMHGRGYMRLCVCVCVHILLDSNPSCMRIRAMTINFCHVLLFAFDECIQCSIFVRIIIFV